MEYVISHPEFGHMYRCQAEGSHLSDSSASGVRHCVSEVWEDSAKNPRLFGLVLRDNPERQTIERTFKSLKETRRLNRHCIRGIGEVTLHAQMLVLAFLATALVRVLAEEQEWMRWMVRRMA